MSNALLASGFPDQAQESHHLGIVNSLGHLRQQDMGSDRVEVGLQIDVPHARFALHNRLGDPRHGIVGATARSVAIRPLLEVGFEDRFQDELERSLDPRSRTGGIDKMRWPLPPPFGIA
ncbi:MAG TPA: hypothetical protein VFY54_18920 [Rubrobacter sp.]|nr:hypothetical protein [Rubrobacter sp.]